MTRIPHTRTNTKHTRVKKKKSSLLSNLALIPAKNTFTPVCTLSSLPSSFSLPFLPTGSLSDQEEKMATLAKQISMEWAFEPPPCGTLTLRTNRCLQDPSPDPKLCFPFPRIYSKSTERREGLSTISHMLKACSWF